MKDRQKPLSRHQHDPLEVSIQNLQSFVWVIISIKPEAAIAGVIVLGMEGLELLKGETGDYSGVTTRVMPVGVVREQRLQQIEQRPHLSTHC